MFIHIRAMIALHKPFNMAKKISLGRRVSQCLRTDLCTLIAHLMKIGVEVFVQGGNGALTDVSPGYEISRRKAR